ncbi:CinY protein [Streptomyces bambusae]|uniref:CinY protein n=1 Tax=Streptomyces bambusae TaxID=1550616 RepID=UPI001CFF449D|nr:CinY protein [Streptomyces bambusae]MCB5168419.1 CinY protein [Streptomyces bambusae]
MTFRRGRPVLSTFSAGVAATALLLGLATSAAAAPLPDPARAGVTAASKTGTAAKGTSRFAGSVAKAKKPGRDIPPVQYFGTINTFGQNAEHERITRAALACAPGVTPGAEGTCFEPGSIRQLAGAKGTMGAIGAPDVDQVLTEAAHCDGADYLNAAGYPRTRAQATSVLLACIAHLKGEFNRGVERADALVDAAGAVSTAATDLSSDCTFVLGVTGRGKCNAIEGFGRALHGTEDFYSHSNWADRADSRSAIGIANPPGLARTGAAPFLRLAAPAPAAADIPADLSTGCFSLNPWGCGKRITHSVLNKDNGIIDPLTGEATAPTTPRGQIEANFSAAVQAAIADTRAQWAGFRTSLITRYGTTRGQRMACAMTHDNPAVACR